MTTDIPLNLLCYIVSLHQTTTYDVSSFNFDELCYIVSLHQTTTLKAVMDKYITVVLYRLSTSNHN